MCSVLYWAKLGVCGVDATESGFRLCTIDRVDLVSGNNGGVESRQPSSIQHILKFDSGDYFMWTMMQHT